MKRWTPERPTIESIQQIPATPTKRQQTIVQGKPLPLSAVGVDVARGGQDKTTLAARYGGWYDRIQSYDGKQTYNAPTVLAILLPLVKEGGVANIDGIGIGAAVVDHMRAYVGERANAIIFSQG
jgi:hypothetical protein